MLSLLVLVINLSVLYQNSLALGPSCGGRELSYSPQTDYWVEKLKHEELTPFNPNPNTYKTFRNVKDFGAKGDGVTDDTTAINLAISEGNRCGKGCDSSSVSPAIVYFPAGTYLVSNPLVQFYFTQFIGDAHNLPTLLMAPSFKGIGLIDTDPYEAFGVSWWVNTNNFYRQIRNFIIDTTKAPKDFKATGIHWQVAQATSITNVHVRMSTEAGNLHQGIFMDNGSGGFLSDVTLEGGNLGLWLGSQQFTCRNVTISKAETAITIWWTWGWTFKGIAIDNCKTGFDITRPDTEHGVGSIVLMDSKISNTDIGFKTLAQGASPGVNGTINLDHVQLQNVPKAIVLSTGQVVLEGGSKTIDSWALGRVYNQDGKGVFQQAPLATLQKPAVLLDNNNNFFEKSKPAYLDVAMGDFVSVKAEGAKGDGKTDDTNAISQTITKYAGCKVIYFPAGNYLVSDTVLVPAGSRIVGEIWSVIMATGAKFADINNPKPVFQLGNPGDEGVAELSELLFSTLGPVPGAILVQINIKEPANQKGAVGLWDVHFRVGGAIGTKLNDNNCGQNATISKPECFGAHTMLHIAPTGSAYLENVWAWVADHDLDGQKQVSAYNGRGILSESTNGPVWMYGTASEHSVLYQYNIVNSKNVIMAMIQIETPYYQSYPPAPHPFSTVAKYNDPDFSQCPPDSHTCPVAWGLRIVNSEDIFVYGAGLYSFFQDYDQSCIKEEHCQDSMVSIEKSAKNVHIFNLNTKASDTMITVDGKPKVLQKDNKSTFCSTIAAFLLN